jgi:hypothetical protein
MEQLKALKKSLDECMVWCESYLEQEKRHGRIVRNMKLMKDAVKAGFGYKASFQVLEKLVKDLEARFGELIDRKVLDIDVNVAKLIKGQQEQIEKINILLQKGARHLTEADMRTIANAYHMDIESVKQEIRNGVDEIYEELGNWMQQQKLHNEEQKRLAERHHAENMNGQGNIMQEIQSVKKKLQDLEHRDLRGKSEKNVQDLAQELKLRNQQGKSGELGTVKGICGDCGTPVYSTDERRISKSGVYFHGFEFCRFTPKTVVMNTIKSCPGALESAPSQEASEDASVAEDTVKNESIAAGGGGTPAAAGGQIVEEVAAGGEARQAHVSLPADVSTKKKDRRESLFDKMERQQSEKYEEEQRQQTELASYSPSNPIV